MPSIELDRFDEDSITLAASSARSSIDPTGDEGAIRTSQLRSSLSLQSQQRRRQQPRHVNSSENRRGTATEEANHQTQQLSQQDQGESEGESEEESETGSTSQGHQQDSTQTDNQSTTADQTWLHRATAQTLELVKSVWEKGIKNRQAEIAVVALIIGILMITPTFGQYAESLWSNAVTYQNWCKDEQAANHTLTSFCSMIVNKPMPPPPGLNDVFKDIGRRESKTLEPRRFVWPTPTKEELEEAHAFIQSPTGNGILFAIYGFFALMFRLEDDSGKWARFLFMFQMFYLFQKITLTRAVTSVSVLMDWCYWLRRVGIKSPSLGALAVIPVLYGVGYMLETTFTAQIIVSVVSVLIVGNHYSERIIPFLQILEQYQALNK